LLKNSSSHAHDTIALENEQTKQILMKKMEMKKLTYEAPKVQVFGVETQNCFASGFEDRGLSPLNGRNDIDWDEE